MPQLSKDKVNFLEINSEESGQRVDNYLHKKLKGVPKSHIYKIIRSGEVRINQQKVSVNYQLQSRDIIRIPPIKLAQESKIKTSYPKHLEPLPLVYEDDALLVINKPAGLASHGGSGIDFGVIERLRAERSDTRYLELIHRLDKDTSGLLMIAKKRKILVTIHEQLRQNHPKKIYLALSVGKWHKHAQNIKLPLSKYQGQNGEKMVRVDPKGQYAHSHFEVIEHIGDYSLLKVTLKTGRTHQIRVHMQSQNTPIAGDERYGNYAENKQLQKKGLKRMFLHAYQLKINYPNEAGYLSLEAPLPKVLENFLEQLRTSSA